MELCKLPRRPSEILGIEDELEALLLDITFLQQSMEPTSVSQKVKRKLSDWKVREALKRREQYVK